jgi:hypothetical protein
VPISSLVVHLNAEHSSAPTLLAALESDPRITLGERVGNRLPVVVDAADIDEAEALFTALRDDAAVAHVDVVFVELPVAISGAES